MSGGNKGHLTQVKVKGDILSYPVDAAATIYRGTLTVIQLATGGLGYSLTKGNHFAGVAEEGAVNAGALGAKVVRVRRRGIFRIEYTRTVAQETIGAAALVTKAGGLQTMFTVGATSNFRIGDWVTIAGLVTPLDVYNGTFRVMNVVATTLDEVTILAPYVAGTPAGTETMDIAKTSGLATDLGMPAYLITVQTASVDEQVHAATIGQQDVAIVGQIVKIEAIPSPYVWVDIEARQHTYQPAPT